MPQTSRRTAVLSPSVRAQFARTIRMYYKKHRRHFAWRETQDPYKIFVSEIMLQQTQAIRVVHKYEQFIKKFPTIAALARASLKDILALWQGLGYNRRALLLKRAAEVIVRRCRGKIPRDYQLLLELPGVGPSTAAAVMAFAFGEAPILLETNIRAVYIHYFFSSALTGAKKVADADIVRLIDQTLDRKNPREWYYALMDYGAMLKKKYPNPSRMSAHHQRQTPFRGSNREIRGRIVVLLTRQSTLSEGEIFERISADRLRQRGILKALHREGFLKIDKGKYRLA